MRIAVLPLALLLLVFSSSPQAQAAPLAGAGVVVIALGPGRDGSQTGTATLTAKGGQTEVVINVQASAAGVAQPAHIHEGGCPGVGPVIYPLTNVVDGKSTTLVNAGLGGLLNGTFAINVHESAVRSAIYTSCGNVQAANTQSITIELVAGREGGQTGSAMLTAKGDQTEVVISVQPPSPGVQQPAHIHTGSCPNVGAVVYPLTNVVDGRSTRLINAKLADLLAGTFGLNVHKSTAESGIYTSCGNVTLSGPASGPLAPLAPAAPAAPAMVKLTVNPQVGTHLIDGAGRTLYLFTADELGRSNCSGPCAERWPPLATVGAPTTGPGASAGRLGTITRADGITQVTYNGWPLYYNVAVDQRPGDVRGQGANAFGGFWFVVSTYGGPRFNQAIVRLTAHPTLGSILTDPSGRVLYLATFDEPGKTNCFGSTAERWPPLLTIALPAAGEGARADLLRTLTREEGSTQVTYNGWPLYYFNRDIRPGDVAGQGVVDGCGAWWALNAAGQAVERRVPALMPATGTAGLASEVAGDPVAAAAALLGGGILAGALVYARRRAG